MLKKAASGVLALLPCSRTGSTLRAPKGLRPCWTDFFDHSPPLLTSIVRRAFTCHGREIFNRPPMPNSSPPNLVSPPSAIQAAAEQAVAVSPQATALLLFYRTREVFCQRFTPNVVAWFDEHCGEAQNEHEGYGSDHIGALRSWLIRLPQGELYNYKPFDCRLKRDKS